MATPKNGSGWRNALIGILVLLVGFFGGLGVDDILDRVQNNADKATSNELRLATLEATINIELPAIKDALKQINRKLERP